jgi:hypothetical protein
MSKSIAVAAAVSTQLNVEGHWPPNNMSKIMGKDYHYIQNNMRLFLVNVQDILKNDDPSFNFQFDDAFTTAALGMAVVALVAAIDGNTN